MENKKIIFQITTLEIQDYAEGYLNRKLSLKELYLFEKLLSQALLSDIDVLVKYSIDEVISYNTNS